MVRRRPIGVVGSKATIPFETVLRYILLTRHWVSMKPDMDSSDVEDAAIAHIEQHLIRCGSTYVIFNC
jgi:hypothetical protein